MTIARPDWNYDNSGNALVPAAPSHEQLVSDIAAHDGPTGAAASTPAAPAPVPAKVERDANGKIIRPDWNQPPATVHAQEGLPVKSKGFSGLPDWSDKPRNESGQYVSTSEGEYRARWSREGGVDHVVQTVMRKEAAMLSVAPTIEAKIATLDKDFLMKAADHLRLSPGQGADGFWRSVKQFED